jgi:hypothetical protein
MSYFFAAPKYPSFDHLVGAGSPTSRFQVLKLRPTIHYRVNFGLPSLDRGPSLRSRNAANRWLVMIGP